MDFVGFLKILPTFVDLLAWPLLALGYPLCASIRAIEKNSRRNMRKLVTYWILFSLISLFELTFVKLIEWVPFWHYIKLIAICWLMMPHFDGACYAYQCLRHPCLSMNLQVINLLNKPNEVSSLKKENFLAVAERYIQENGSESLEKLIANKSMDTKSELDVKEINVVTNNEEKEVPTTIQPKLKEIDIVQEDIKAVEPTVNNGAAAGNGVKIQETNLAQIEKKTVVAQEAQERTLPEELLPASKNVQKEWTCAVCQVTTQSQTILDSHLKGRKHMARCKELKVIKQTTKKTRSLSSTANKSIQTDQEPKKYVSKSDVNVLVNKTCEKVEQKKQKLTRNGVKQFELWCGICNVRCLSEIDLAAHLNGKRHLSNLMI